jgi:replicative superfamily II helicase/intein/homing endonuclease
LQVEELPIPDSVKAVLAKAGYDSLYPPQEDAIRAGVLEGKNLVLASPTASGKTLVAELAALKSVLERDGKVLYLTPLRALASEKYEDFQKYADIEKAPGRKVRVAITSGDYDSSDLYLANYDIIISTNEKADSLLRHRSPWISDVSVVIADEIHLITEADRGPTLEVVLTRLLKINPSIQVIALSATIRNAVEIGEWLEAVPITTEWRPVPLREGVYYGGQIQFKDGSSRIIPKTDTNPVFDTALEVIRDGGQVLIFTETRRLAVEMGKKAGALLRRSLPKPDRRSLENIAQRILSTGERTRLGEALAEQVLDGVAFHHAGLPSAHRKIIEESFKAGRLKILSATPTLAAGVNLPARTVVISSYERYEAGYGRYPISVLEYKQFCLPHDAPITLRNGVVMPIGDIVTRRMRTTVLTLSNPHGLTSNPIRGYFEREATELVKISTNIGRTLTATPEHPVLAKTSEDAVGWTSLRALRVGDRLAYAREIPTLNRQIPMLNFLSLDKTYAVKPTFITRSKILRGNRAISRKLRVNPRTLESYLSGKKNPPLKLIIELGKVLGLKPQEAARRVKLFKSKWGRPTRLSEFLTEDFMWLVGIIASDGHLQEGYSPKRGTYYKIRVFNQDRKIIDRAVRILRKFELEPCVYRRQTKHYAVEIGSNLLGPVISQFGVPYKRKSFDVFVPDFILQFPRKLISAYLAGVFDGDGSYSETKYPRGHHTMVRAIVIATGSKRFAWGIHDLLLRLGVMSTVATDSRVQNVVISGKERTFTNPVYRVTIRSIADIQRFRRWIKPTKITIPILRYSTYHNSNKFREPPTKLPISWVKVTNVEPRKLESPVKVYNLSIDKTETYLASNFVVHNCGRAGRPKYDKFGEAVLIGRTEDEQDYLLKNYTLAEPERIWSKLGAEKVLRPHVLATVATRFATTEDGLERFFARTFYAFQYDPKMIKGKLGGILSFLHREQMVEFEGEELRATKFGRRVSELYIDPVSAVILRDGLYTRAKHVTDVSLLHLISRTPDISPKLYPRRGEDEMLDLFAKEHHDEYMCGVPEYYGDTNGVTYEEFLAEIKCARVLYEWINETSEDGILQVHRVEPGDILRMVDTSKWLLHATYRLAELFDHKDLLNQTYELQIRCAKGVKSELVPLVELDGVGRVRARSLFNTGFKNLEDLRHASVTDLMNVPTIGPSVAKKIKEQVGGLIKAEEWEALKSETGESTEQSLLTDYKESAGP